MNVLEMLLDLLFPPKCPFCKSVLEKPGICPGCDASLPWTAGDEVIRKGPDGLRCCAPLRYEGAVRTGILRFKFGGASGAARPLGELLARCAAENFSGEFDLVTWVPVSRKRKRKRGYDQAELLARHACRLWDIKPVPLLKKTQHTSAQSSLGMAERRANVLGVYEAISTERVKDRRILLVDDVCTTFSTLAECARVLKEAGAAEVLCAVVAHASMHKKGDAPNPGK